jgi:hypothetical protein
MSRNISVAYQPDGSVVCNGGVDPNRTATYSGPKNSANQLASIQAFYALEPDDGLPDNSPAGLRAAIPTPASTTPPAVSDAGASGSAAPYARGDHTHASKARKDRLQTAADGTLTWTYGTPFGAGVTPRIGAIAEVPNGVTDVYNVQLVDTPTNTAAKLLVNRLQKSVASLLSLTVLSVPATPGVTWLHLLALEP